MFRFSIILCIALFSYSCDDLNKLTEEVAEYAKVEVFPKFEGKQIMMVLVPQTSK